MDYFKIDGRSYAVLVTAIEESFNILYSENTGRTMSQGARMTLDPLGTFFGHKVTVKRKQGYEAEFDALYNYVSHPRYDGISVEIAHNQTVFKVRRIYIKRCETVEQNHKGRNDSLGRITA